MLIVPPVPCKPLPMPAPPLPPPVAGAKRSTAYVCAFDTAHGVHSTAGDGDVPASSIAAYPRAVAVACGVNLPPEIQMFPPVPPSPPPMPAP
jgi:hypothetical protein